MEIIVSQSIGFLIGVLSSFVFWYLLIRAKPYVAVSPVVVFNPSSRHLLIKVRNESHRQSTDIQASLALLERKQDGGLVTLHIPKLQRDTLIALGPIQDLNKPWSIQSAFTFVVEDGQKTLELLTQQDDKEKRLVFVLSITDGLSGTKVVHQVVYKAENVKQGKFGLGFRVEEV